MDDFLRYVRNQWDRVAAWLTIALGALALLLGWLGVSRSSLTTEQIPYVVSGGLVGIFLLGVGAVLWLSADLRDEWRKLDRLQEVLERRSGHLPVEPAEPLDGRDAAVATPGAAASRPRE